MEQRERTQVQARSTKPKVGHNGGKGTNHIRVLTPQVTTSTTKRERDGKT
jgi:hypothetical protein